MNRHSTSKDALQGKQRTAKGVIVRVGRAGMHTDCVRTGGTECATTATECWTTPEPGEPSANLQEVRDIDALLLAVVALVLERQSQCGGAAALFSEERNGSHRSAERGQPTGTRYL